MINWDLIKNPFNWFIVLLMVVIAMIGFHSLFKLFGNTSGASPIPDTFNDTSGS
jgi:hypothetical protein